MNYKDFRCPPNEYRPVPFWSWNDDLDENELRRQIREMAEKGWGGFFMHARVGLRTPYLSRRWMRMVKACVEEARAVGINAWLYDENGWPSGRANGMVESLNIRNRAKHITYEEVEEGRLYVHELKRCKIKLEDGKEKEYVFFWEYGIGLDQLDPEPVRQFLDFTHELYRDYFQDEFGKTIPGVFTDEPQYANYREPKPFVPWTERLFEEFEVRYGYSLLDKLECLFFNVGPFQKVRYDYWSLVTDLYVNAFSKQIYEWCQANNLKFTGHQEWEDTLLGQVRCIGSAMPHYEYMHIPGIDKLGRHTRTPWVVKQVSSVASQLGKERVLCEAYGVAGQNLSFHDMRWIANWLFVLGINFLNPHLALYSMRGEAKRDHPPNLFYQQPWWDYSREVADYFSRLSYVMSQGRREVDVLLIHPIGAAWSVYRPDDFSAINVLDEEFQKATLNLLGIQRDFDYGDEKIMARYARVEGVRLVIGGMSYKVVIIPPMVTISRSTFEILKRFVENGGKVFALGEVPVLVGGEESEELGQLSKRIQVIPNDAEALRSALDLAAPSDFHLTFDDAEKGKAVYVQHRRVGQRHVFFIVNSNRVGKIKVRLSLEFPVALEKWDPETGCRYLVKTETEPELDFELNGGEGCLLVSAEEDFVAQSIADLKDPLASARMILLDGEWKVRRISPNSATLDFCRYRIGQYGWKGPVPVREAYSEISKHVGMPFEVVYEFECAVDPDQLESLSLVLETPEEFDIFINSQPVRWRTEGWWVDRAFKTMNIHKLTRKGRNEVVIRASYLPGLEIEDAYLIGDFGVKIQGRKSPLLISEPETVYPDDLTKAGYSFFAGAIVLTKEVELNKRHWKRAYLVFRELNATVAEIKVNQREVGRLFWEPYRVDVSDVLREGCNVIEFKLVNSLRNLLGPLHSTKGEFKGVGPRDFWDVENWTDEYVFVPLGFSGAVLALI